jgi:hypothetical protein
MERYVNQHDFSGHGVLRAVGIVGLAGIALIHLLDLQSKWHETRYLGLLYIVLIVACAVASAMLLTARQREAWMVTAACAVAPLVAYFLSRTVGLPDATGDTGNWLEPLGLASLYVEGMVLILGAVMLKRVGEELPVGSPARSLETVS